MKYCKQSIFLKQNGDDQDYDDDNDGYVNDYIWNFMRHKGSNIIQELIVIIKWKEKQLTIL